LYNLSPEYIEPAIIFNLELGFFKAALTEANTESEGIDIFGDL
tara:strand:- start:330 stop:458 length:129 start_codon:yes stop_codon:yes gene_type:complete